MDAQPEETDYTSQLDKEFLDKVMKVIEEELSDSEFSINDFCRMLGMSRTSVYNKIKTLTGQGPNDFIRIVRLNKAKELLVSRKWSDFLTRNISVHASKSSLVPVPAKFRAMKTAFEPLLTSIKPFLSENKPLSP